jgi:hypothetical protein
MNARRLLLAVSVAVALLGGISIATPAGAGIAVPHDLIASPNTGPVGTHITISNAENSPCGGQKGDGPAQADVLITQPDGNDELASATADENGNWSLVYLNTTQVGTYLVDAECIDVPSPISGTDFDYTEATFVITAADPTTTAAPTTTSTAAAAAAVDATAAFTG